MRFQNLAKKSKPMNVCSANPPHIAAGGCEHGVCNRCTTCVEICAHHYPSSNLVTPLASSECLNRTRLLAPLTLSKGMKLTFDEHEMDEVLQEDEAKQAETHWTRLKTYLASFLTLPDFIKKRATPLPPDYFTDEDLLRRSLPFVENSVDCFVAIVCPDGEETVKQRLMESWVKKGIEPESRNQSLEMTGC
jgi:hypothetical protein